MTVEAELWYFCMVKRMVALLCAWLILAILPAPWVQAAMPEASLAVSASLQPELLDVKQSPILCSEAVIRIVHENPQVNRSSSSQLAGESGFAFEGSWKHPYPFGTALFWHTKSKSNTSLFLSHCNWRL